MSPARPATAQRAIRPIAVSTMTCPRVPARRSMRGWRAGAAKLRCRPALLRPGPARWVPWVVIGWLAGATPVPPGRLGRPTAAANAKSDVKSGPCRGVAPAIFPPSARPMRCLVPNLAQRQVPGPAQRRRAVGASAARHGAGRRPHEAAKWTECPSSDATALLALCLPWAGAGGSLLTEARVYCTENVQAHSARFGLLALTTATYFVPRSEG